MLKVTDKDGMEYWFREVETVNAYPATATEFALLEIGQYIQVLDWKRLEWINE